MPSPVTPPAKVETRVTNMEKKHARLEERVDVCVDLLGKHSRVLDGHTKKLDEHSRILDEHTHILNEHSDDLRTIKQTLAEHTIRFDVLEDKVDQGFERMDRRFDHLEKLITGYAA